MRTIWIFVLLSTLCTAYSCLREDDNTKIKNYITVGEHIPSFMVEGPTGEFTTDIFNEKKGMIVFFASYCDNCKLVLPKIDDLWKSKQAGDITDFEMVVISRQTNGETPTTVAKYWQDNNHTMPYHLDPEGRTFNMFANIAIPRIYLLNTNGTVANMWVSSLPISSTQLKNAIKELK